VLTRRADAWYIVVKTAEIREGYQDLESARPQLAAGDEYRVIVQFDNTYQQTGVREGVGEHPTYAEVVAGPSNARANHSDGAPPSYNAIVEAGNDHCESAT
jgi:hypothetical protein